MERERPDIKKTRDLSFGLDIILKCGGNCLSGTHPGVGLGFAKTDGVLQKENIAVFNMRKIHMTPEEWDEITLFF